jgi:hypothetical protein
VTFYGWSHQNAQARVKAYNIAMRDYWLLPVSAIEVAYFPNILDYDPRNGVREWSLAEWEAFFTNALAAPQTILDEVYAARIHTAHLMGQHDPALDLVNDLAEMLRSFVTQRAAGGGA